MITLLLLLRIKGGLKCRVLVVSGVVFKTIDLSFAVVVGDLRSMKYASFESSEGWTTIFSNICRKDHSYGVLSQYGT